MLHKEKRALFRGQSALPTSHVADKKARWRHLWQEFFSDPSQWWDNRLTKKNFRCPDFEHKFTHAALWLDNWLNPSWVKEKIAISMAPGQVQLSGRLASRVPTSYGTYDKIQKLSEEGRMQEAVHLLELMAHEYSVAPRGTLVCVLRGCARWKALAEGKQVHALIVQTKCHANVFLSNLLIEMYSNCGSADEALKVFAAIPQRNVFSWTAMISAYVNSGQYEEALTLFQQMQQNGIEPDQVTCVVALKACTSLAFLKHGQQLHTFITKRGFDSHVIVQTSLIDMYARCGCLKEAFELFNNMSQRNVVSWNVMIAAYAQKGFGKEALDLYEQMKHEMEPNNITIVLLLKVCASISALERGKELHSLILEKGFEFQKMIQTALMDMYAKCGCLRDARELFNNMDQRDVVSWSAMIAGYAQKGLGREALDLYEQMKCEGLQANEVTYTCILSACRHSCLVDEGQYVFESMVKDHGVTPTLEHYACMVDLLGRAGFLADAKDFVLKMPIQPDEVVWMSLLGAARKYVNVEIGKCAFEGVLELKSQEDAAAYLLLIDIYSAAGRMDEVAQLRKEMKLKGLGKVLGCNWIEVDDPVHTFIVGD